MTANKLEGKARDMHSCSYYCDRPDCVKAQRDQLREAYVARQAVEGMADRAKYDELLYAVGNKYPGESRHETALRYIRQAEQHDPAAAPQAGKGDAS